MIVAVEGFINLPRWSEKSLPRTRVAPSMQNRWNWPQLCWRKHESEVWEDWDFTLLFTAITPKKMESSSDDGLPFRHTSLSYLLFEPFGLINWSISAVPLRSSSSSSVRFSCSSLFPFLVTLREAFSVTLLGSSSTWSKCSRINLGTKLVSLNT
jgi:hypothetical protein